jgi:hypothetical protein
MTWRVVLTIDDPSEAIIRVLEKRLRDEWIGFGEPLEGITVEVAQDEPGSPVVETPASPALP